MKIVIDARMCNESGIGRYIRNLIATLEVLDKQNEYFILLLKKDFEKYEFNKNFKKILANFRWYGIREQLNLPKILNDIKSNLVHLPHFNVPLFFDGKFVVTIHDLIHQHFQMRRSTTLDPITYKIKQFSYRKIFDYAVNKSQKILVPSNYIKDLLMDGWNIPKDKIIVTYEAVDDKIFLIGKIIKREDIDRVMQKFNITIPYIFYVGNAHPHKNVEGLIKAFLKLKENYRNLQLVLSGYDHYFWQRVKQSLAASPQGATASLKKDIIFTGYVSDEELVSLYKNAQCFVMPSFEEGFGIPLLEAMVCGCPVVSSKAGALFEVGGDAVLYFDPTNVEDIADKISQVLGSEKLKKELIAEGYKRVKFFSWEKLTRQTLEVYRSCV